MSLLTGNEPAQAQPITNYEGTAFTTAEYCANNPHPHALNQSGLTVRQQLAKDFACASISGMWANPDCNVAEEMLIESSFKLADAFIRVNNELEAKKKEG